MTYPADTTAPPATPKGSPLAALRRADALVLGGALLVLVFSFLPQLHASEDGFSLTKNMWSSPGLAELFPVTILAVVIAVLTLLPLLQPTSKETPLLVATPAQWAGVLSVVPFVTAVFSLFFWHKALGIGYGAYVEVIATAVLLVGALGTAFLPQLAEPLTSPKQAQPPQWGDQAAGAYGPPAGWGQQPPAPGAGPLPSDATAPQWGAPVPGAAAPPPTAEQPAPSWGQAPEPAAPPVSSETIIAPQHAADMFRQPEPAAATPAAPAPTTDPFWACFPSIRPLVDPASSAPVGQVTPEEWYLVTALDGRGATVQTTDGRTGLLSDVSGMVRADG